MNYKTLAALCAFLSLAFLTSATKSTHSETYSTSLTDDDDDGSTYSRILVADYVQARDTDIEGTVAYIDGDCVLVRTCFPSAEYGGKLACTEEHVCEY